MENKGIDFSFGCLSLGYVLFFGVATALIWQAGFVWQLAITLAAALILLAVTKPIGRQGGYRFKVAGLLSLCLSLILFFAALYSVIFRNAPNSFRLSDNIIAEHVRDNYLNHSRLFLDATRDHYYLTLMRGRPSDVLKVLNAPVVSGKVDAEAEIGSNEVLEFRCWEELRVVGWPTADMLDLVMKCDLVVRNKENTSQPFKLREVNPPSADLVEALRGAKTEGEIIKVLDAPIKEREDKRNASQTDLSKIVGGQTYLEMSHFIYFSAASMTTVGSNEMSPNSRVTRYLVVLQSLAAVFFFSYALHVFWPEKIKAD